VIATFFGAIAILCGLVRPAWRHVAICQRPEVTGSLVFRTASFVLRTASFVLRTASFALRIGDAPVR
jgi:hypothetical protein